MNSTLDIWRVNRTAFSVVHLADAEDDDREFWLSKTPEERLHHLQLLRVINYGHAASARLQRVLEVAQQPRS